MKNGVFWDVTPVALVRTGVSEERSASIIRTTRIYASTRCAENLKNAVSWDVRRVALVKTVFYKELIASLIRVTRIGELGALAVTSNRRTLRRNTMLR
jgi:hypothetical protein